MRSALACHERKFCPYLTMTASLFDLDFTLTRDPLARLFLLLLLLMLARHHHEPRVRRRRPHVWPAESASASAHGRAAAKAPRRPGTSRTKPHRGAHSRSKISTSAWAAATRLVRPPERRPHSRRRRASSAPAIAATSAEHLGGRTASCCLEPSRCTWAKIRGGRIVT